LRGRLWARFLSPLHALHHAGRDVQIVVEIKKYVIMERRGVPFEVLVQRSFLDSEPNRGDRSGSIFNMDSKISALAISDFAEAVERARSIGEVVASLLATVEPLGYIAVASGLLGVDAPDALHFVNWPADWLQLYTAKGFISFDPVPLWAIRSGAAVTAGELRSILPAEHPGHQIFKLAEQFGLFGGYIVPQRACDSSFGLVCFVGAGDPRTSYERLLLRGIAGLVFERAEALSGRAQPANIGMPPPEISERERECLKHLVRGKSARETARSMKISEATVRFHISNLHRKTGVKSRSQLIALAISTSLVQLRD
jgi:DNA-binding CsgD family transcriptional regulator